jgi:lysophospholipase L1-like esterase
VALLLGGVGVARALGEDEPGVPRGVVGFVGDSNIVHTATPIAREMTPLDVGYVPVIAAASGASIRWNGCTANDDFCPDPAFTDYWAARLAALREQVQPDVWVVELGINDALALGTPTTRGYDDYAGKIDYLMAQLEGPVVWTNLPCSLEPPAFKDGCRAINAALAEAPARHPNLTLVLWGHAAYRHPEYMLPDDVHLTMAGKTRYAEVVAGALETLLP